MADKSPIEWTEATWNPIVGCSILSPGCTHCYAMKMAARIEAMSAATGRDTHYAGTTKLSKAGPVWTGKLALAPDHILTEPLRWKRPRRIFVNSMSDLFHEDVPDEWIDQVFAVMAMTPQHTFQILTKRASRMREYVNGQKFSVPILGAMPLERVHLEAAAHMDGDGGFWDELKNADGNVYSLYCSVPWPLPNVWLGVSTERRQEWLERTADLRETPAAVRFVSAEPLLADLGEIDLDKIDWIIVGGESGHDARPMHPDWSRSIRDQCAAAGTAFFFKQWGGWKPISQMKDGESDDLYHPAPLRNPEAIRRCKVADAVLHRDGSRHDDPRDVQAFAVGSGAMTMFQVGKKRAGRLLDGQEHNEMPGAR